MRPVQLTLGAGHIDRLLPEADELLRLYREDTGRDYLDYQPVTPPDILVPEDLAVTLSVNSQAGWRAVRSLQVSQEAFPGEREAWKRLLWTNLVKFVCVREIPVLKKPFAEEAIRLQEGLLAAELRIAQPEICLFVTGPDYDWILERYFPGIRHEPLEPPDCGIERLKHSLLPDKSYRTYHPKHLRLGELWMPVFQALRHELGWPTESAS